MALSADRVQEVSASAGTGAIVLGGAASPELRTFSQAFADGALVAYVILNQAVLAEWERGIGTYNATLDEIVRTYVTGGSNGASPVNFSAGTKSVLSAPPPTSAGAAWSATQVYAPGDTATSAGSTWYCLAVNLNSAPAAGNANWSAMGGGSVSYPISIANGGTGQTTAAAALSALGGAPINNPTFTGTVLLSGSGTNGYVGLFETNPNFTGYVGFYSATGVRQGYVGWNDGTTFNLNCEGANLLVSAGSTQFTGQILTPSLTSGVNNSSSVTDTTSAHASATWLLQTGSLTSGSGGALLLGSFGQAHGYIKTFARNASGNGVGDLILGVRTGGNTASSTLSPSLTLNYDGSSTFSGSVSAPTVTDTSDFRIKSNVQSMLIKDARRIVAGTKCVRFDNDLTHRPDFGVIADDQLKVTPELVLIPEDAKAMKSMNYQRLVAPLCQVVTDLMGQVDKLKTELAMLRAHVDDVRMR